MSDAFNVLEQDSSVDNVSYQNYVNPYLDLTSVYHPRSSRELLGLAKTWFYGNSIIKAIVSKFAEYSVTRLIYTDTNQKLCDKWKHYLEHILKIHSYAIHAGLNYFGLGNHIMSVRFPSRRKFVCSNCLKEVWEDQAKKWDYRYPNFYLDCEKCGGRHRANAIDIPVIDYEKISFHSWDPIFIHINYSQEFPDKTEYFYKIPPHIRKKILVGYKHQIAGIPALYVEAVKKHRMIKLNRDNLFHMKSHTLAEEDMAWGKPLAMASFKKIHYIQVLNKAQEAIALDRANPLDIFFPQGIGTVDPVRSINMVDWEEVIRKQITRSRRDLTYKAILPFPVGAQRIGGDAKALLLTPEIDSATRDVAGGMGCPQEFIYGGLSWSGSSVSLRVLENSLLIYREQLLEMVHWIQNKLSPYLNLPPVDISFSDFKMADDPQQKQIALQLYGMGLLSGKSLLEEWGWDVNDELRQRSLEEITKAKAQLEVIDLQSKVQGKQMVLMAKYQAQAQLEGGNIIETGTKDSLYNKAKMKIETLMRQQGNYAPKVDELVDTLVNKIISSGPEMGQMMLETLKEKHPNLGSMVEIKLNDRMSSGMPPGMMPPGMMPPQGMPPEMMAAMQAQGLPMQATGQPAAPGDMMNPMPEKLPPRRAGVNA